MDDDGIAAAGQGVPGRERRACAGRAANWRLRRWRSSRSPFCPFPRPHRIEGWSLADKVMDIQLARSLVS
ncbi:hypothetical protein AB5I41_30790 [Sphingomonas sp. MMS24-JH45]